MSTHLFSSRQACMSCLDEGGKTRKAGKGLFSSVCNKYTYTGPSAISKAWEAKWSFSGTQPWQPSCLGQQVVPPASILATVLSWVATSTHSYQDNVLFFLLHFSSRWVLFWGLLWSRRADGEGVDGERGRREEKSR